MKQAASANPKAKPSKARSRLAFLNMQWAANCSANRHSGQPDQPPAPGEPPFGQDGRGWVPPRAFSTLSEQERAWALAIASVDPEPAEGDRLWREWPRRHREWGVERAVLLEDGRRLVLYGLWAMELTENGYCFFQRNPVSGAWEPVFECPAVLGRTALELRITESEKRRDHEWQNLHHLSDVADAFLASSVRDASESRRPRPLWDAWLEEIRTSLDPIDPNEPTPFRRIPPLRPVETLSVGLTHCFRNLLPPGEHFGVSYRTAAHALIANALQPRNRNGHPLGNSVLRAARRAIWGHFVDRPTMSLTGRIYRNQRFDFRDYLRVFQHRHVLATHPPALLPALAAIPEHRWGDPLLFQPESWCGTSPLRPRNGTNNPGFATLEDASCFLTRSTACIVQEVALTALHKPDPHGRITLGQMFEIVTALQRTAWLGFPPMLRLIMLGSLSLRDHRHDAEAVSWWCSLIQAWRALHPEPQHLHKKHQRVNLGHLIEAAWAARKKNVPNAASPEQALNHDHPWFSEFHAEKNQRLADQVESWIAPPRQRRPRF